MIYFVTFSHRATTNVAKRHFTNERKEVVNGKIPN